MLTLYRRHTAKCSERYDLKENPQEFTRCQCPIYAYGTVEGRQVRLSLKCRDWARAERKLTDQAAILTAPKVYTLAQAISDFFTDSSARGITEATNLSRACMLRRLAKYIGGDQPVTALTLDSLSSFRAQYRAHGTRPLTAQSGQKLVKQLRTFCGWLKEHGRLAENYARALKPPADDGIRTRPFEAEEVARIIEVAQADPIDNAIVLTFLYTGFRISDVVRLRRESVDFAQRQIMIRVKKTRAMQYIHLHPALARALRQIPDIGQYFFAHGAYHTDRLVRLRLTDIFERSGVRGTPHMFRDTFAVELLRNGVAIRTVQLLLGHSSVVTTERHYAPWMRSFQERLDEAMKNICFTEPSPDTPGPRLTLVSEGSGSHAYVPGAPRRA